MMPISSLTLAVRRLKHAQRVVHLAGARLGHGAVWRPSALEPVSP